ncbi:hypothetical protein KTR9_5202 (plasmid) [Gordonia sp. KTR9]|nr:hypothetical protein KTR9_5202 [Gordonia sp. KTR9]
MPAGSPRTVASCAPRTDTTTDSSAKETGYADPAARD